MKAHPLTSIKLTLEEFIEENYEFLVEAVGIFQPSDEEWNEHCNTHYELYLEEE